MADSQIETHRKSNFYIEDKGKHQAAIRKLTNSGTLFTDVGNSQFFERSSYKQGDSLQKKVSITGDTVTQAGSSQFYSKPPVADLAYTPPHILSKDTLKPVRRLAKSGTVKFPQLKEFAHFHYNKVNVGAIKVHIDKKKQVDKGACYAVIVESNGNSWVVERNVEHFILLDRQLHYCVFDRGYSNLTDLELLLPNKSPAEANACLFKYLDKFSTLTGNNINCGTVLNFFELNSAGGKLISPNTESAINIPAVAAALVTKAYHASDFDELELKEGDLISVIDKPPSTESSWWRGKKELMVGFFPSECVEVIGNRKSSAATGEAPAADKLPVLRKRDKVIAFLRQFFLHRPPLAQLKQSGIVKGRVFGTDLGEYLTNSALLVPRILTCCCEVIERHGLVDGIYRLSGRATLVQELRETFDLNKHDTFSEEVLLDIHCVSTLLKTYFRELPNPLLTFQLYDPLVSCVQLRNKKKQIASLRSHISTLPPPHYRTAKYLFAHLARLSVYNKRTSMTSRNLAIVWAPNLIRYDETSGSQNPFSVLQNVSLQAAVTDLLISNYDSIFGEPYAKDPFSAFAKKPNVKSISKRLVSLATARKRKGDLTRNYNSTADYLMIPATGSKSLESTGTLSAVIPGHLAKSQSISLDSVFTSSSSSTFHLLEATASTASLDRVSGKRMEMRRSHTSHTIPRPSSSLPVHSKDLLVDTVRLRRGEAKATPLPKPRQPKKVHEYVNFDAQTGKAIVVEETISKPQPAVRSPPAVKRAESQTSTSSLEGNRPYTVCTPSVEGLSLGTHPALQRHSSAPYKQEQHYAVTQLYPDVKGSTENTNTASGRNNQHVYVNVTLTPHHVTGNEQVESGADDSSLEYDNNVDDVEHPTSVSVISKSQMPAHRKHSVDYVNVQVSPQSINVGNAATSIIEGADSHSNEEQSNISDRDRISFND